MPHVSKKEIEDEVFRRIDDYLISSFSAINNKEKMMYFLTELLSHTERLMMAKRLAIILMLNEKLPTYYICEVLGVSSSTVLRIKDLFDKGEYSYMIDILGKKKKSKDEMIEEINSFFRMGLPPIAGRGRWKWLYKQE